MSTATATSDSGILDLLRKQGPMSVAQLARETRVTPTAVRQRLTRLMAQGMIDREVSRASRGRPSHRYLLTEKGQRQTGANFADLTLALWQEIRAVPDLRVRRGLFKRIAQSMAKMYQGKVKGTTVPERMKDITEIFAERQIPFVVEEKVGEKNSLPVLTALACPYPELAEQDQGICAVERMLFSELLQTDVRLSECRLNGDSCCRFATN